MPSELKMKPSWEFSLDNDDLVLVLKALGGRLSGAKQLGDAQELGNRLTSQRATQLRAHADMLEKHVGRVDSDD